MTKAELFLKLADLPDDTEVFVVSGPWGSDSWGADAQVWKDHKKAPPVIYFVPAGQDCDHRIYPKALGRADPRDPPIQVL